MTLLPQRMASQLMLLLTVGLLASHCATVAVFHWYNEALSPIARDPIVEHMASAYHMAQVVSPAEIDALLTTFSSDEAQFYLMNDMPKVVRYDERVDDLYRQLVDKMPDASDIQIRVEEQSLSIVDYLFSLPIVTVHASARLPDGRWLMGIQRTHNDRPLWIWVLLWLPVSVLPSLLVAVIFLYRTMRPIKALTHAAEQVSRGDRVDLLEVEGAEELQNVSTAFNIMQTRLTRFIDDRTRLLAAISHDIRTSIASLRIRAELVEDTVLRNAMVNTLQNMSATVEQTLSFARDASGKPMREIDLYRLIEEVVFDVRAAHPQAEIILQMHESYRCRVWPNSLQRALTNLLVNAVRHGEGEVHVRLLLDPLRIVIDDQGKGVDKALLEQLFEPFIQGETDTNKKTPGLGLGLSIARSCARAHGGDVYLDNLPEGGFRATLQLF